MRLNKYIAHYSSYSRREADEVIQKGFVTINGETEPNPAYQVQERDSVTLHGRTVTPTEKFTVIVYHKKKGELVTKNDPQGRRTVYESLDAKYKHFIPVGRLDFATEGLLLFTDASYVATALMESDLERIYNVKINGPVTERMIKAMDEGLELDDATAGAHKKE
jgi:23S rRNA pseudouridine2605 synthase